MAVIKSGASSDQLTVDAVSKAARVTIYDPAGVAVSVFDYANSNPLAVRLTDLNGDYIAAGAGTQYTEGDVDATIIGSALLWEDAGDTLRAVSAAKPLPVEIITGGSSGVEYTEGDVDATITGKAMMMEGAGNALVPAQGTVADGLLVNLGSNNDVTVASLPLPAGAATEATLSTLNGKVTACNTGAVVISSGSVTADTELTTADLDTGAGSDVRAVVGLVGAKSGGGQLIPGDATAGLKVDLGADNDVTVSGTVTANAGTDLNTSALALEAGNLATIAGDTTSLDGKITACNTGAVVVASGSITVANAGAGSAVNIQDGGNSITVDGSVTVTATNLDIRDLTPANDTVAIGDGVATATIRNLAANDALNVAIVDAAGDQITSFGGGTQYTEDAAAAANPVGTSPILVRQDTPAGLVSTDGDNVAQRGTNYGAAFVQVVTSAGAFVDSFGGGSQYAEDSAHSSGHIGTMSLGVRNDTRGTLAGTDGDYVPFQCNASGDVRVDGSGVTQPASVAPAAYSVDLSTALEASSVSKASAGRFYKMSGRIDSTAPTGTYYIQILNASSVPGDGAVTHLIAPLKLQVVNGIDYPFSVDATGDDQYSGVSASTGIVWCISTTEFTKTISSAYVSATVLYV